MSAFAAITADAVALHASASARVPVCAAGQQWNARDHAGDTGFVPQPEAPVARLFAPRAGEQVPGLGGGDGVLARRR